MKNQRTVQYSCTYIHVHRILHTMASFHCNAKMTFKYSFFVLVLTSPMSTDASSAPATQSDDFLITTTGGSMVSSLCFAEPPGMPSVMAYTTWDGSASVWSLSTTTNSLGVVTSLTPSPLWELPTPTGSSPSNTELLSTPLSSSPSVPSSLPSTVSSTLGATTPPPTPSPSPSPSPLLCSTLTPAGHLYLGGCSHYVHQYNLGAPDCTPTVVAQHDAPVRSLAWIPQVGLLVTAGWDALVRFWDTRQSRPTAEVRCPGPIHGMDFSLAPKAAILCARRVLLYNMVSMGIAAELEPYTAVRHQMRCVALSRDGEAVAAGSVDGRVMVKFIDPSQEKKTFSFRAHADPGRGEGVYPVNSVQYHPLGTLLTAGSDGVVKCWDVEERKECSCFRLGYLPISCAQLNTSGTLLGFALSYDWTRGAQHYSPSRVGGVVVKALSPKYVNKYNAAKR